MNQILPSIIQNQSEDILQELLQSELLSDQEVQYLTFIKVSHDNSGIYPPVDLLLNEFPELRLQKPLSHQIHLCLD